MFFTVKAQNTSGGVAAAADQAGYMVSVPATNHPGAVVGHCQLGVFAAEKATCSACAAGTPSPFVNGRDLPGRSGVRVRRPVNEHTTIASSAWGSVFFHLHRFPRPARAGRAGRLHLPDDQNPAEQVHAGPGHRRPSSCRTTGTSSTSSGSACSPASSCCTEPGPNSTARVAE